MINNINVYKTKYLKKDKIVGWIGELNEKIISIFLYFYNNKYLWIFYRIDLDLFYKRNIY